MTGKKFADSDSDADADVVVAPSVVQKKRQTGAILPPVRHSIDGLAPIETRRCPVQGCDSMGHLGKAEARYREFISQENDNSSVKNPIMFGF